ncbi:MAG: heme-binding protein [Deltaproteobacteria bacterium]|nr:heme-binding protein [Deltaproteobacteria bacterium]
MSRNIMKLWLFILLLGTSTMAYEEPKYSVLKKWDKIEIRQYESYLVAETLVQGNRETSGKTGFKLLASYIFGKNQDHKTISMTAPVIQEEKDKSWSIQFMMPAKYSINSLPSPNSPEVLFRTIPNRKLATITYSGTWSETNYQENLAQLKTFLEKENIKTKGLPMWARYNSPFTPWFLRKNEVLIEVD